MMSGLRNHGHPLYKRIHRAQLLKTLGMPETIPVDFCGVFPDTPVYEWYAEYRYSEWDPVLGRQVPMVRTEKPWGRLTIIIQPSHRTLNPVTGKYFKSSNHRVFFRCKCDRLIPVGRSHQHLPACPNSVAVHLLIEPNVSNGTTTREIDEAAQSERIWGALGDELKKQREAEARLRKANDELDGLL